MLEEFVNNVVEMKLESARFLIVKLVVGKSLFLVIFAYVSQIERSAEEKNICGDAVCDLMVDLKMHEIVNFVGDLNGHMVKRNYCHG